MTRQTRNEAPNTKAPTATTPASCARGSPPAAMHTASGPRTPAPMWSGIAPTSSASPSATQWVRVDEDGASNPVDITGATSSTYTLTDADVGKKLKVRVSFQDNLYVASYTANGVAVTLDGGEGLAPSPWPAGLLDALGRVRPLRERILTGRDLLLGSSFHLVSQAEAGGARFDGDVTTGMLGADAETGTGVEVGAGLRYSAGMLSADAGVRTLLAHEAGGYEEWGAGGSTRLSPSASGLWVRGWRWRRRGACRAAASSGCGRSRTPRRWCRAAYRRPVAWRRSSLTAWRRCTARAC